MHKSWIIHSLMTTHTSIGAIEVVDNVADIKGKLSQSFCSAVSVKEDLAADVVQAMKTIPVSDLLRLSGVIIEGGRNGNLKIHKPGVTERSLDCPSVPLAFGLPAALVKLIKQDHMDFLAATDNEYAISALRVGDDLAVCWHDDRNLTARKPQAHRNLSDTGMYVASANPGIMMQFHAQTISGRFYRENVIDDEVAQGRLTVRKQEPGERLYFRAGFLHKSGFQWYQRVPEKPHLRLLTRGPL